MPAELKSDGDVRRKWMSVSVQMINVKKWKSSSAATCPSRKGSSAPGIALAMRRWAAQPHGLHYSKCFPTFPSALFTSLSVLRLISSSWEDDEKSSLLRNNCFWRKWCHQKKKMELNLLTRNSRARLHMSRPWSGSGQNRTTHRVAAGIAGKLTCRSVCPLKPTPADMSSTTEHSQHTNGSREACRINIFKFIPATLVQTLLLLGVYQCIYSFVCAIHA